jgi:hypothetical protein
VTLAVSGNIISGRVVRRRRMQMGDRHKAPLAGCRWDMGWLSGRGKTPTFCVLSVLSVVVREKCCDACGDEECYIPLHFSTSERCQCL